MRLIDSIKRIYYRLHYAYLLKMEKDMLYPLEHRIHLVKYSFIVVDCEVGCYRAGLKRIIKAYLKSRLYEKERIPLLIVYGENSPFAQRRIKPFLKKYEDLRLKVWFYEASSQSFGMSVFGKYALAYINANRRMSALPSIDEHLVDNGTKVCMFKRDAHWKWMFPDMVCCDSKKEYLQFFKDMLEFYRTRS